MIDVRQIPLRGADNVRDLGGLATRDGRRTREGRLIRSASVQELTELDIDWLVERIGVRTIVNLRLARRCSVRHSSRWRSASEDTSNLPVRTGPPAW